MENVSLAHPVTRPQKILSKKFRDDPFAEPPPITEDDIS